MEAAPCPLLPEVNDKRVLLKGVLYRNENTQFCSTNAKYRVPGMSREYTALINESPKMHM